MIEYITAFTETTGEYYPSFVNFYAEDDHVLMTFRPRGEGDTMLLKIPWDEWERMQSDINNYMTL